MLRAIREIRPTWVVGENVAGIVTMVESCEEVEMGRADDIFEENIIYRKEQEFTIERICKDFEREGYSVQPIVIPACAVGAPHRRDRVWFIANRDNAGVESMQSRTELSNEFESITNSNVNGYSSQDKSKRIKKEKSKNVQQNKWKSETKRNNGLSGFQQSFTDTECGKGCKRETNNSTNGKVIIKTDWRNFPTKPPVCCGNDGISNRLDGITFPKWRAESIKAYGNAWVPQVAFEIFKAISNANQ